MKHRLLLTGLLVVACLTLAATDALAWGPNAKKAITGTAVKVVRRTFSDLFETDTVSYEDEVFQGALDGPEALGDVFFLKSDAQAIEAVSNQIVLLREMRKYGVGSYMSYRMGVLAALVSDLMLPFAVNYSPEDARLREQVESDIDARVREDTFRYQPGEERRQLVVNAHDYFGGRRVFFDQNRRIIRDDYAIGIGYNGFLKKGAEMYFGRSIDAVANVWYSVLVHTREQQFPQPSKQATTWYLVREIEFLIEKKRPLAEVEVACAHFEQENPGDFDAIVRVGDIFYNNGYTDRGVREWEIAYSFDGPHRTPVGKKLSAHYIGVGQALMASAASPAPKETDLSNASNAFQQALEFDRTNADAARLFNEAEAAKRRREEEREMAMKFVAAGETLMNEAWRSFSAGKDPGHAIFSYNQAIMVLKQVDDTFAEQKKAADARISEAGKKITDVVNAVLSSAEEAIDAGDELVDQNKFDEAIARYESVARLVSVIPDFVSDIHKRDKADTLALAEERLRTAQSKKAQWERQQQAQQAPAETGGESGGKKDDFF